MPVMHGREDTEKESFCGQLMEHLVCSAAIIIVRGPLVCQIFHVAQLSRWGTCNPTHGLVLPETMTIHGSSFTTWAAYQKSLPSIHGSNFTTWAAYQKSLPSIHGPWFTTWTACHVNNFNS